MVKAFLALVVFAAASPAAPGFEWKEDAGGRWHLSENGKPVLTYNAGVQHKEGAPEDRKRCCYVFPAYSPAGVNPLDDFPRDHWHHRGLFWAWPIVESGGQRYDLWMYRNVHQVSEKVLETRVFDAKTHLKTRNFWVAGDKKLVREDVLITVHPAQGNTRELLFDLTFEALDVPVTLRGSAERGKSYGGLSARFAPREGTAIRTNLGRLAKDDDLTAYEWAELEAAYAGKRVALRITPDPANPHAPHQWCLRYYGFIGASFPGRTETVQGYTLEPGKPLTLKFRVQLSDVP